MKAVLGNPFVRLALRRPGLWPGLLAAAWTFRRRGWHRRAPFLPLPSAAYMRWRMETAYGESDAVPPLDELAGFVRWSAEMRRRMRPRSGLSPRARLLALALVALAVAWINLRAGDSGQIREMVVAAGYPGLFLAALASGFNVIAPVPVAFFHPFLVDSGFASLPVLVTIALGMTTGDLVGFLVGRSAREFTGAFRRLGLRMERVLKRFRARHPLLVYIPLFLYAALSPFPNEIVVIPLAFMGYSLPGVMITVLCGNVVFNAGVAFGASWVWGWFGG